MTTLQSDTKPNGPVVAAFLAAGVASLVMGIGVVLNEASATIKSAIGIDFNAFLQFDKNFGIGSGVGPLSGKVGLAVIAFVVSWVLFHLWLRGKEVNFRNGFIAALVLVGLGFALTFPPIFDLFAPAA
ncbi:MAG TPA: hypothetical protein VEO91_00685 [Candidatus Limnocylindria bacterium]|nr:hypothetical protein [Candidatus Limnocylindria bacterium]